MKDAHSLLASSLGRLLATFAAMLAKSGLYTAEVEGSSMLMPISAKKASIESLGRVY